MGRNKGSKPQTIYNIGTANLEIDYQKLAEAIVKANHEAAQQERQEEQESTQPKQSFAKLVWEIWTNKRDTNGRFTTAAFSIIANMFFKTMAIAILFITFGMFAIVLKESAPLFKAHLENAPLILASLLLAGAIAFLGLLAATVFWGASNEIDCENNRDYVLGAFSGIVSLAALIVALVALFKG